MSKVVMKPKPRPHLPSDPCITLASKPTVSSALRFGKTTLPVNHLDLVLSSKYDHHTCWLVDRPDMIRQPADEVRSRPWCKW